MIANGFVAPIFRIFTFHLAPFEIIEGLLDLFPDSRARVRSEYKCLERRNIIAAHDHGVPRVDLQTVHVLRRPWVAVPREGRVLA